MAFLTDEQLLNDLSDLLKKEQGTLLPYWGNIVSAAHGWAYAFVVNTLAGRGFTLAQITAWDLGPHYERDLTLWKALVRGGGLEGYDDRFVKMLDVREELSKVSTLVIDGVFQQPEGAAGTVGVGAADTSRDVFVWPDPNDEHLGEVTRF